MKYLLAAGLSMLLLSLPGYPVEAGDNQFSTSDALESLLDQADASYLAPRGGNIRTMISRESPKNTALVLGITLHGQTRYLADISDSIERIAVLEGEIHSLLNALCKVRGNKDTDGSRLTGDMVYYKMFLPGVRGENNELAHRIYGVNPGSLHQALILDQVLYAAPLQPSDMYSSQPNPSIPRKDPPPPAGKLINKDPCSKCPGMCLLGVCAE